MFIVWAWGVTFFSWFTLNFPLNIGCLGGIQPVFRQTRCCTHHSMGQSLLFDYSLVKSPLISCYLLVTAYIT